MGCADRGLDRPHELREPFPVYWVEHQGQSSGSRKFHLKTRVGSLWENPLQLPKLALILDIS